MSLTWGTSQKDNSLAQQFPTFRIDDVTSGGNVNVTSKSPSGKNTQISVVESAGIYTANFTPTEVGYWHISVTYDSKHIRGSPFQVRVYDADSVRVYGLENGACGKKFKFTVDTTQGGDGVLEVSVKRSGSKVAVKLDRQNNDSGKYDVEFIPTGPGLYLIDVSFSGMIVRGSPFKVDILDAKTVVASGNGLSLIEVNQRAQFTINTGDNARNTDDLRVSVTSPQGRPLPIDVFNLSAGMFRIEYPVPCTGDYRVEVLYHGNPIKNSPFIVHGFDCNNIKVRNIPSQGVVGKAVEFDIDTANAGYGDIEISINEYTIPCTVSKTPPSYHAKFMPQSAGRHTIDIRFNGRPIQQSPFLVTITNNIGNVTVAGAGLRRVPIHQQATFEIHTGNTSTKEEVIASVSDAAGKSIPTHIVNYNNGNFLVEYTPVDVGVHNIDVFYSGERISGSPFACKVYDSSAIVVSDIMPTGVGQVVKFKVDTRRAGEGELAVMINEGKTRNKVETIQKGIYIFSYVPENTQPHSIQIRFNDKMLPKFPLSVPVIDTNRVTVQGEGLHQAAVNKESMFKVRTGTAGNADLAVRVTGPNLRDIPVKIEIPDDNDSDLFEITFTPITVGNHRITITYIGKPIIGSPFTCKVYDIDEIMVEPIRDALVNKSASFCVLTNKAGEGNLTVKVEATRKRSIPNRLRQLTDNRFDVTFTPDEACDHFVYVHFNGVEVNGSPFCVNVTDASLIKVYGDGLNVVACHRPARFTIHAPGANHKDFHILCTGPDFRKIELVAREIKEDNNFHVDWVPEILGHHQIHISYRKQKVPGSPFQVKSFDQKRVQVIGLKCGYIGRVNKFKVDAGAAGPGELSVKITCAGLSVPHQLQPTGRPGIVDITFTPMSSDGHVIEVTYNRQQIAESPFYCIIADGKKVLASGKGLTRLPVNQMAKFHLNTESAGKADVKVKITDPSGGHPTPRISGNHKDGYDVEYKASKVGRYRVDLRYADIDVAGSPYKVEVYDISKIEVLGIQDAMLGRIVNFRVETKGAGAGDLTVSVYGFNTEVKPEIKRIEPTLLEASFIPMETAVHTIEVTFNSEDVPKSPYQIQIFDISSMKVDWSKLDLVSVDKVIEFSVNTEGVPEDTLSASVTDANGKSLKVKIVKTFNTKVISFVPVSVGAHQVSVQYSGHSLDGSPYTCDVYNCRLVKIDCTKQTVLHQLTSFTVNSTKAGKGDLDVSITTTNGHYVRLRKHCISSDRWRYEFTPKLSDQHEIFVQFNGEDCKDCSRLIEIIDPQEKLEICSSSKRLIKVGGKATVQVNTNRLAIETLLLRASVKAPNGELVPSRIVLQPDKNYTVEYSSKYTGRHMVETLYAGQPVMGSPFYVEIYDPNKIRIEGGTTGTVGIPVDFEVISSDAGKAELGVSITSPSGRTVNYELSPTPRGDRVRYVPVEQGAHQIFVTYGGLNVPATGNLMPELQINRMKRRVEFGCPISQDIKNDTSIRMVFGEGAQSGMLNQATSFFVDTQGRSGDLFIHIQGPSQTMQYTVTQELSGRYCVTYTPTETGQYRIDLKFNGQQINGTPLHPIITDRGNVTAHGVFERMVNGKLSLNLNQLNTFEFDTSRSGEGVLRCEVRGPNGSVPVNVQGSGGRYIISYMPTVEGEYQMSVYWNGQLLPQFPVTGATHSFVNGLTSMQTNTMHQMSNFNTNSASNSDKVILTGMGLNTANAQQMSEFVIDGSQAGQGTPIVKMTGESDVAVNIVPISGNKYQCSYTAMDPGFYMLSINWSDRQVTGSPFKVNVVATTQSQNVRCTGEGLTRAVALKQSEATIDVREAGPGMISAQCMGPTKVALCQIKLVDLGIYKLTLTPQEFGRHVLQIKYGKEHVPGSPFEVKVSRPADPTKVRVSGPGIENGILATYRSHFLCEMQGAGTGQLVVRVRGPSGAFNVDIQKGSDRTIMCRYDPTDVGKYKIQVLWSGVDVPGSPFTVAIFDTKSQLDQAAAKARYRRPQSNGLNNGVNNGFGGGGGGINSGINAITLNDEF